MKTGGKLDKSKTQLQIDIPNLLPKNKNGKTLPYSIRVEVIDHKGNSTIETIEVYSKY